MRYFSRGHRCIAYSARGYTPSDVPPAADLYTYQHFYTDALAVLDHLKIAKAHLVGLSMGSYSSLQIGLNAPERALSMTLAAVGAGSNLENLESFRKQCRANAEQYDTIGSAEVAKSTREAPTFRSRICGAVGWRPSAHCGIAISNFFSQDNLFRWSAPGCRWSLSPGWCIA